jgi:glutamate N-acetyltransferase/amino-acid N-acetyltransferase
MAVGLAAPDALWPVGGIRVASGAAGIRYRNRNDLVLLELTPGSHTVAIFTRNAFSAAPIAVARNHLSSAAPRLVLINSGNANAGTGTEGVRDALACCEKLAELFHCRREGVIPFSTGVIGERLPVDKVVALLPDLKSRLGAGGWLEAARAIMTTDSVPKGISRDVVIHGKSVTVTGIAKGAGMIRPDMATMLAFLATDARVNRELLADLLQQTALTSFNSITVDGDTSTNDACVLTATGQSGVEVRKEDNEICQVFSNVLRDVMEHLAQSIVRDGEGATKFVTIAVNQAASFNEARTVAYTLAHSLLVKTALYASDPNWGRILAALGRAEITQLDIDKVDIYLDDTPVFVQGARALNYTEQLGQTVMQKPELMIRIDLHRGQHHARIWTTDLSHDYIRINAEYRS